MTCCGPEKSIATRVSKSRGVPTPLERPRTRRAALALPGAVGVQEAAVRVSLSW